MSTNGQINANKKKAGLLGESGGAAQGKLKKLILYSFICRLEENICFRCGKKIETIEELSIDHKNPWMKAENPKEAFFDLENIAFSHLSCNSLASERKVPHLTTRGEENPSAKLNWNQVREIRNKLKDGKRPSEIVREYEISFRHVDDIKTNRIWKE
jgi:hypothetical protein